MTKFVHRIARALGSQPFLYVVLGLFVVESVWIALSAAYPMAFDEDFHLGIIKIYSHHWLPFLSSQPDNAGSFGAVARDPSYLYHYLMSFPYRLISAFTHDQTIQVIWLRLLNVMLLGGGLVLFRRLMLGVGASRVLANVTLTIFILIPIVPLLAGEVNYDNLLLPLLAGACLLTLDVYTALKARAVPLKKLVLLLSVCLSASLVKYAFLPIFAAVFLFLVWTAWRAFRARGKQLRAALIKNYRAYSGRTKIGLATLLVVAIGMFSQRYVVNAFSYHTPLPDCAKVLSEDVCMSYGPWARDYQYSQAKGAVDGNPAKYTVSWLQGLHYRLFFMISGSGNGYKNYPPLPLPSSAFIVLTISSVAALVLYWRKVFAGHEFLVFLLLLSVLYAAALWAENYTLYKQTGAAVAVNGRYLLPVLLPFAAVLGRALGVALRSQQLKIIVACLTLLLFLQGGGWLSFILRSDASWYFPNQTVVDVNDAARKVVAPLVFESSKYY